MQNNVLPAWHITGRWLLFSVDFHSRMTTARSAILTSKSGSLLSGISATGVRMKTVRILGTHGIPANYGGFETAAENVAKYLAAKGWRVIVYCQGKGRGPVVEDVWHGIERVTIPVDLEGWRGTSKFDWLCIAHACQFDDLCLTFGYNTGIYNFRLRMHGIKNIINMDGIEWSRKRWGFTKQAILYVNERFAALFGNQLIADHPEIRKYLCTRAPERKITTITYGADPVVAPSDRPVLSMGLQPGRYLTLIARPIPENSILELIRGFTRRERGYKLVVLGDFDPDHDPYHGSVKAAASGEVLFPGAIYDPTTVQALRYHSVGYLHGHTVGGTNPSLVEAMAAGNPIIAHANPYNKWVAQDGALYFTSEDSIDECITRLLTENDLRRQLSSHCLARYSEEFTWDRVAGQYEDLLSRYL
jgi:glycosyltransferase involved in cell wall biosynthesis